MQEAKRGDAPDTKNLRKVVSLVQVDFSDGTLAYECTCQMEVLIPKVGRDLQGDKTRGVPVEDGNRNPQPAPHDGYRIS